MLIFCSVISSQKLSFISLSRFTAGNVTIKVNYYNSRFNSPFCNPMTVHFARSHSPRSFRHLISENYPCSQRDWLADDRAFAMPSPPHTRTCRQWNRQPAPRRAFQFSSHTVRSRGCSFLLGGRADLTDGAALIVCVVLHRARTLLLDYVLAQESPLSHSRFIPREFVVCGISLIMATERNYYDGFRTFSWFADLVGLPIDQVNFLLTQFTALVLAGILRSRLSPATVTPGTRHVYGLTIGLALGYFCFGRQAVHLVGLPAICYIAMRTQNPHNVQRVVLAIALIYLSCIHLHRQMYDYGSYKLDITGPLMVITQKVTSLAYSIHDGLTRREEELTQMQRHQAVKKMPSTLEYFSYIFHFQALMAGPIIFYRDYIDFIYGNHLPGTKSLASFYEKRNQEREIVVEPSPTLVVVKKVTASLVCALIFVTLIPTFPIQRLKENEFLENSNMFYTIIFLLMTTMLARFKYYHAWLFADAICNNSGLGFNGYDEQGNARWDMTSNVDVYKFETSLTLRDSINNWNKGTNLWLRSLVYERTGRNKVLYTYALSAIWHGFYPGYYLTFASGALFTIASRSIRRHVRPLFLESRRMKIFYDVVTFITTRIVMAYITFSFILLEFVPSIKVYLHLYLLPHLLGLIAILVVPRLGLSRKTRKQSEKTETDFSSNAISNGNAHKTM